MKVIMMAAVVSMVFAACGTNGGNDGKNGNAGKGEKKIGVLLVNHGSRSEAWRNGLLNLEKSVEQQIMADGTVGDVKTAFMEYTEPSIATRLKEFDAENYTDIVLVPIFLTVSSHSFDDIPTLIGQKDDPKSIELFKIEKMERYTPKATVHIAPLLDFTDVLKKNILRRYRELSKGSEKEGLVLIAYGDKTYNTEWSNLMENVAGFVKDSTGVSDFSYNWCGHIAHYNPDSTSVAIRQVVAKNKSAVVIPVLVAFDEMFQVKIIGDGINKIAGNREKVIYRPDAILPDTNIEQWVIQTSRSFAQKIGGGELSKR